MLTLNIPWANYIRGVKLSRKELWALDLVVYLVIHARHYNRRKDMKGYAPIAYGFIRDIVGEPGLRALGWLQKMNVVARDKYFVRGGKSYGFKITETALRWGYSVKTMPHLYAKKLCPHSARISLSGGLGRGTYAPQLRTLRAVSLSPEIWTALATPARGVPRRKTVLRVLAACHIRNGNWFFSVHDETGRCFNNVTSFPSDLRKYLLINGKHTVELDIACSQPALLVALLYRTAGRPEERARAESLVQSGTFYSTLCTWAGKADLPPKRQKPAVFKGLLFSKSPDSAARWPGMGEYLPTMAGGIDDAKREAPNALALRLQALEAKIMLGRVMPTLAAQGICAISIHDGCRIAAEHAAIAKATIEAEFLAETGLFPTVRIKEA